MKDLKKMNYLPFKENGSYKASVYIVNVYYLIG